MAKQGGVRRDVVHCENCGEDYSITYKRCPFCNAKPGQIDPDREDDRYDETYDEGDHRYEETPYGSRKGGKRLSTAPEEDRRGGGHGGGGRVALNVVGLVVSLALIAAAVLIIVTQVVPKFKKDPPVATPPVEAVTPSPTPAPAATPVVTPAPSDSGAPALPDPSGSPLPADPAVTPAVSQAPAPTGLRLSSTDFTLDTKYPSYQMSTSGGTGAITWASGNTAVATVTVGGLVRGVASGNCTVTATDAAGNTAKCIVRVNLPETGPSAAPTQSPAPGETQAPAQTPAPTESPKPAAKAKLSSTDFTLSPAYGMSHRLTVSGGTASAWSSSNEAVATVSQDGTVTGLAAGNCTVTATLADGGTLKCVVRVAK